MAKKRGKGGWYGEPGRHSLAARGISTKGVTSEERELRRQTFEYLAGKVPADQPLVVAGKPVDQPLIIDVTDELVEDNTEWAADKIEDRLNELGFWDLEHAGLAEGDQPKSEKELFDRIANSDAPDDIYSRLGPIVSRDHPELSGDQIDRVANDAVTAGAKLIAHHAWQDMLAGGGAGFG